VAEAAQRVATGDLPHAVALLPVLGQPILAHAYDDAFRTLIHLLVAITLAAALVVLGFLGRTSSASNSHDATATPQRADGTSDR
jgi:hypothetical protein